MKYDDAIKAGALAFFGDKCGEVRVLAMGEHSTELCGSTHVARTGDISFQIVAEGGVPRRAPRRGDQARRRRVRAGADRSSRRFLLKAPPAELSQKIAQVQDNVGALEKELARLKAGSRLTRR
jgi:alanyl-tRNA synthetase